MAVSLRLSALERRSAILESAIKLFSERGFRGVTTRELAQAVGVSEPVLYQHFPSKKELYKAIIEETIDRSYYDALAGLQRRAEDGDDYEFFIYLAQAMVLWHQTKQEQIRLKLFAALEGHELIEELHDKQGKPFIDIITNYIRRRSEEGAFADVHPEAAALAFCGMVGHYCQSSILFRSTFCKEHAPEQAVEMMTKIFLNGIRTEKS